MLTAKYRIAALLVLIIGTGYLAADWFVAYPLDVPRRYVGRSTCGECHQDQVTAFAGSHHDLAMDLATEDSVLGDFSDSKFQHAGVTTRFFRRDGRFMVNTEGPDGQMHDYEVKYTFGVEPLQQYMVEFPNGKVQVLRVSWDTEREEWFFEGPPDVPPDERILPDDPLHWTGIAHNWNSTCAECHSTNLEKNYDPATDSYDTTWTEIDVSCEECHGPASLHVELARSRSLFWDRNHGYGLAKLKGADTTAQLEACAKCHSRRHQIAEGFRPGKPFSDFYQLAMLEPGLYHVDGQIRDEVYEYGSFLQSKMHAEGVRCTDCHDPHSLKLKFVGNQLCNQCHVAGKYDSPTHHHHPPDTAGAQCVACHMRSETYMVVDPRRDHSFRVPRPDLTVELGVPNACNDCHQLATEDAAWAAEQVRQWGGAPKTRSHFAHAFDAANTGDARAAELLAEALRDKTNPPLVRATAVTLLGRMGQDTGMPVQRAVLEDLHPLVRAAAVASLPFLESIDAGSQLERRLTDSSRSVRIVAARRYVDLLNAAGMQFTDLSAAIRQNWQEALDEYRQAQAIVMDQGAGNVNLAELAWQLGDTAEATRMFRRAVEVAPYLAGPRDRLALLLDQSSAAPEEARALREEEAALLKRNAELIPGAADIHYNLARMNYLLGRWSESLRAIEEACRLQPSSYDFRLFLTLLLERQAQQAPDIGAWDKALASAVVLEGIRPEDPVVRNLASGIRSQRDAFSNELRN